MDTEVTAPARPKRKAAIKRQPIILDLESDIDELESGHGREELPDSSSDEHRPSRRGSKSRNSKELDDDDFDALQEIEDDILDEDSIDEGDPEDNSEVEQENTTLQVKQKQTKKSKVRDSAVALHRRMIRRIKDISYWGDHSIDPGALRRKEAARPFLYDISAPARGNVGKVWYFDTEKEEEILVKDIYIDRTRPFQKTVLLDPVKDAAEIATYFWQVPKKPLTLFLGPFNRSGQQQEFKLKMYDSISLTGPDMFLGKNGWVVHVGNEVQSLDWATRQPGSTQFLAIGVKFQEAKPTMNDVPPGFCPCVCPSQIQIWRIPITTPNMTPKPPPVLDYTLVTDWGAAIEIKWRPGISAVKETGVIGHIMALFEDGQARLIEIKDLGLSTTPPTYRLTNPMLTLHLNTTLLTVFTWIDTNTVAFGTSTGSIAIYNLNTTSPSHTHLPTSYYSIQSSYIASMTSLAPSFPHLLATSSLDGSFDIHDIREPHVADTLIHRSRTVAMSTPITWCEMAQSLCYPEDLSGVLCMGIRKAKKSGGFLCSNNPGDTVAASTGGGGFHPFLLSGGRDGKVRIVNLIRKYFYSKCQAIQQIWFQLEYAPTTEMYRMLDGFKPEMVVHRNKVPLGLPFFEYLTNVTRVGWNNNREFATWAAAGMGCGLVRIEDVSLDVHQAVPVARSGNKEL